ncbi:S-layer homology domain-containing protein, partial [Peptococcaceae bacterium]|nr:S-layer homology domain-containing protein [Peptococcaceae bacterium]
MFRKILLPVFTVLVCALLIFSGQGVAVNQATAANTEATLVAFADLATAEPNLAFINYLVNQQVIAGFPDNTFRPGEPVTRAQAAALMVRAAGLETGVATATFSDVGSDHWATAVIAVAEQAGYLAGFPDGTFRPEEPITRAQGISLVLRLAKADLPVIPLPALDDMASNHWAAPSVAAGLDAGMVVLAAGNRFAPDNAFTRAEMSRALALGLTLSPGTREQPLSGRLVPREGTVKLKKAGETAYRVVEDEQLVTSGDQVQTGANSQAEILFPDGTGLLLKDRVHMGLEALRGLAYIQQNGQPGTAVDWLELDLQKGKIFFILSQSHGGQDVAGALPANEPDLITYQPANSKLAGQPLFAQLNPVPPAPPAQVQTSTVPWWKQPQQQRVRLQVNMPFGVAGVRGTTGSAEVLANGHSEVRNLTGALGNLFVQSEDAIVNLAPAQFTVIVEKGTVEQAENMTAEQLADFAVEAVQEFLERQAEIADNVAVLALTAVAADLITQQETVQAALTEAATRAEEQPPAAPAAGGGGIGRDDDDDDDRDDRAARVTSVAISGLGIVGIPDGPVAPYHYIAAVKDQREQVMAGEEVTWSVQQKVYGVDVSFDNNNASVTVAVYAQEGTLELVAVSDTNEAVTATKQIIISTNPHQHINPAVIDIALPAPNVTGTLTIGEQPVTNAGISFGRWETKDGERQLRWAGIGADTGTDGRFQTIILEPGSYQVRSIRDWDSGLDLDHSSLAEFTDTDTAFEITAGQTPVELNIDL